MQIDHHNYEEFFLMYVDNELSPQQKEMVEAYIRQHPELAGELDLLKQTVSDTSEAIHFADKERLMSRMEFSDEELLTYLDGEATSQLADKIKTGIQNDEVLRQRIGGLEKVYLPTDETYIYPRKNDLYRQRTVRSMDWWKIAVAASLLICISAWLFLYKGEDDVTAPIALADTSAQQQQKETPPIADDTITLQPSEKVTTADTIRQPLIIEKEATKKDKETVRSPKNVASKNEPSKTETVINRKPANGTGKEIRANEPMDTNNKDIAVKQHADVPSATRPETQTALNSNSYKDAPAKEKKKSFLKKIGKKIGDRALDILSDGEDNIHVAGFAINIDR